MAAIITDDFRKINIDRFFDDVSKSHATGGKDYYIGIGKTDPYENDDTGQSEVNDTAFAPPTPVGSVIDKQDIKKNLMTLKLVEPADVKRMVPQIRFTVGTKYKVYNPFDPTCFDITDDVMPCYVTYTGGDSRARIYACLGNNNNTATSEVIPDAPAGNTPFGVVQNSTDKYIWAYVCDWDKHVPSNKFSSSRTFMNLPEDSVIDTTLSTDGITDGRKRAVQASGGLLYGFAISAKRPGANYPSGSTGHPRVGDSALDAVIIGEHLDGSKITSNNTCKVETGVGGTITRVIWNLSNAQTLGYSKATTKASSTTGGTSSSGLWTTALSGTNGGIKFASLVITDSELTVNTQPSLQGDSDAAGFSKAEIIPLIAPADGFGHSPLNDLPSYYAGISSNFEGPVGDNATAGTQNGDPQYVAESLVDVKFREVSLLRDGNDDMVFKDSSGDDKEDDSPYPDSSFNPEQALNCLRYFQISSTSESSQAAAAAANSFSGAYIQQVGSDNQKARAFLDQVSIYEPLFPLDSGDGVQGGFRIYFHQNSSRLINEKIFTSLGNITLHQANGTQIGAAITYASIRDGEYVPNTGEVLFVDKKKPITRNEQQTEEVRLIIQF